MIVKKMKFFRQNLWVICCIFMIMIISVTLPTFADERRTILLSEQRSRVEHKVDTQKIIEDGAEGNSEEIAISQREYEEMKMSGRSDLTGSAFAAGNMIMFALICSIGWFVFVIVLYCRRKQKKEE